MDLVKKWTIVLGLVFTMSLLSCNDDNDTKPQLILTSLNIYNQSLLDTTVIDVPVSQAILASFNLALDTSSVSRGFTLTDEDGNVIPLRFNFSSSQKLTPKG